MDTIMSWSESNNMKINAKKTKEIFVCFNKEAPAVPSVTVGGKELERVTCVTLLGLRITNTLLWDTHTDYVIKRANQRLYCLTMLRRAKVSAKDIVSIFCSKIRPVLEYASPVWHPGLTNEQSNAIEHIQERALRLAYPTLEYEDALKAADIPTLTERRDMHCKALFVKMQHPQDKLNRILPPERENIRNTSTYKK